MKQCVILCEAIFRAILIFLPIASTTDSVFLYLAVFL